LFSIATAVGMLKLISRRGILVSMITVVLGGTSGLGAEIAGALRANGKETFVIGRSYDEQTHGAGMKIDLAQKADIKQLCEHLQSLGEDLNFYWVSGYGYQGDFAAQPSPETMAAVNFSNVLPVAQIAWRMMLAAEKTTHLVVISSTSGYKARKDEAVYAATKHAQTGFARSLGLEAERLHANCKVALFMPGGMQTPFWDNNRPVQYTEFLDPKKVATRVIDRVESQSEPFYEEIIERGSL